MFTIQMHVGAQALMQVRLAGGFPQERIGRCGGDMKIRGPAAIGKSQSRRQSGPEDYA
jgi:hypothetical protein